MARFLLHYDIEDDETRDSFLARITGDMFHPRFTRVTEGVYQANMPIDAAGLEKLQLRIRAIFGPQPPSVHEGLHRVWLPLLSMGCQA